jgi:starch phosphorylase
MALPKQFQHPYEFDPKYGKSVAYFTMELAVHQALKTYSGGLGFLAGSHMRSAYELKQNMVGISILWKYGYYDQIRKADQSMDALFQEKLYSFLEDTGIKFQIMINNHEVHVKAYYLSPDIFGTVPIFFLSTDLPENDYLAQTTSHFESHPLRQPCRDSQIHSYQSSTSIAQLGSIAPCQSISICKTTFYI